MTYPMFEKGPYREIVFDGKATTFELKEIKGAPLIVLVHGFTVPAMAWDYLVPLLNGASFSTLRLNLYGRGGSNANLNEYSGAVYAKQLAGLLEALKLKGPYHLCGYSMGGGVVATAIADGYVDAASVCFIAPSGFRTLLSGRYLPFIKRGRIAASFLTNPKKGRKRLQKLLGDELREAKNGTQYFKQYVKETEREGYIHAIRNSVLHGPMEGLEGKYQKIAQSGIPVHSIWANDDPLIRDWSRTRFAKVFGLDPAPTPLEGGHGIPFTHPDKVLADMGPFVTAVKNLG
ncbi:MAG: alpha/beta hydrolase [Pseudomonadota bacterium]